MRMCIMMMNYAHYVDTFGKQWISMTSICELYLLLENTNKYIYEIQMCVSGLEFNDGATVAQG